MDAQQQVKQLEETLRQAQADIGRMQKTHDQDLSARLLKVEERLAKTPTYGMFVSLLILFAVVIFLVVRMMTLAHGQSIWPSMSTNDSTESGESLSNDENREPDPNVIIERVFRLIEKAMQMEADERKEQPTDPKQSN